MHKPLLTDYSHDLRSADELAPTHKLRLIIEDIYEQYDALTLSKFSPNIVAVLNDVIDLLDAGKLRLAEKVNGTWLVKAWLKKAIHLYHYFYDKESLEEGGNEHATKIPLKTEEFLHAMHAEANKQIRMQQIIRKGSYINSNTILMAASINIGAYIDSGTMIDARAKIGACAQIGKNVHIATGAGIGGVMMPIDATPTIIEDNCYIGAQTEIVDGVIIEENSIISMGVYLDQTTRIYDRHSGETFYGRVPTGSVVIPGNMPNRDGKSSVYCAIIVKRIDYHEQSIALTDLIKNHRTH